MTRRVRREEILDLQRYEEERPDIRRRIFEVKALRRIHLGDHLTFLFENRDTILYQVHEMIRAERLHREADVQRELDTYNELLGDDDDLGCTLLIEIEDPEARRENLRAWRDLPDHLYVRMADDRRIAPHVDERQRTLDRLSAVQFLRFPVAGEAPLAIGTTFPGLEGEVVLGEAEREALTQDLTTPP